MGGQSPSPRTDPGAQLQGTGLFVGLPSCPVSESPGALDGKMNLARALLVGVVSAACRYTRCIVASWAFLPASGGLITGGEQRIAFRNPGPCSGGDRDKLDALAPAVPVRGGRGQLGSQCRARGSLKFPSPCRKKFLRRVSEHRTTTSAICTSKSMLREGWGCKETFE